METEGFPASIFATRDWLDFSNRASCAWVSLRRARRSLSPWLRISFSSTRASSALESPRSSRTVPIFHRARSRRVFIVLFHGVRASLRRFVVHSQAAAVGDDPVWGLAGGLGKDVSYDHRIRVDSVHDPPVVPGIFDTKLMACGAQVGHPAALGLLAINLMGDFLNALFGAEPRALVGVPIAGALIANLMTVRVRLFFPRATR